MSDAIANTTVYVHIPYCGSKCWYCDFNSHVESRIPETRYTDALIREWEARCGALSGPVPSIYFGGGTPSLFSPESIGRVIRAISNGAGLSPGAEITLEANPGAVSDARMAGFAGEGVNRVSMGAQSFSERVLRRLGRQHNPADVPRAVAAVRAAGIDNVSVDLMFGVPDRAPGELEADLEAALALDTPHVSSYCLTIYDDTPFGRERRAGRRAEMEGDDAADEFEAVVDFWERAGLVAYEIANFARPGFESRHNRHYWRREPYIGLGAGAHSFETHEHAFGARSSNIAAPQGYMEAIEATGRATADAETLSLSEAAGEAMFLGLRSMDGIDLAAHSLRLGVDLAERFAAEIRELRNGGWLETRDGRLRLTRTGLFISDEVFRRFV